MNLLFSERLPDWCGRLPTLSTWMGVLYDELPREDARTVLTADSPLSAILSDAMSRVQRLHPDKEIKPRRMWRGSAHALRHPVFAAFLRQVGSLGIALENGDIARRLGNPAAQVQLFKEELGIFAPIARFHFNELCQTGYFRSLPRSQQLARQGALADVMFQAQNNPRQTPVSASLRKYRARMLGEFERQDALAVGRALLEMDPGKRGFLDRTRRSALS